MAKTYGLMSTPNGKFLRNISWQFRLLSAAVELYFRLCWNWVIIQYVTYYLLHPDDCQDNGFGLGYVIIGIPVRTTVNRWPIFPATRYEKSDRDV